MPIDDVVAIACHARKEEAIDQIKDQEQNRFHSVPHARARMCLRLVALGKSPSPLIPQSPTSRYDCYNVIRMVETYGGF